jgi:hypothetical protein
MVGNCEIQFLCSVLCNSIGLLGRFKFGVLQVHGSGTYLVVLEDYTKYLQVRNRSAYLGVG